MKTLLLENLVIYYKGQMKVYDKCNSLQKTTIFSYFSSLLRHANGICYENQILPKLFFYSIKQNSGVAR